MKIISQQYQIILVKNIFMQQKNIIHVHKNPHIPLCYWPHPPILATANSIPAIHIFAIESKQADTR